ncbi:hypothetical protein C8J57DRAFT_1258489 [Mycena rebaudengoi]|nr:hypothetical protein C8J57DRAFT_1258489 [Mycena rebaudengoi]
MTSLFSDLAATVDHLLDIVPCDVNHPNHFHPGIHLDDIFRVILRSSRVIAYSRPRFILLLEVGAPDVGIHDVVIPASSARMLEILLQLVLRYGFAGDEDAKGNTTSFVVLLKVLWRAALEWAQLSGDPTEYSQYGENGTLLFSVHTSKISYVTSPVLNTAISVPEVLSHYLLQPEVLSLCKSVLLPLRNHLATIWRRYHGGNPSGKQPQWVRRFNARYLSFMGTTALFVEYSRKDGNAHCVPLPCSQTLLYILRLCIRFGFDGDEVPSQKSAGLATAVFVYQHSLAVLSRALR